MGLSVVLITTGQPSVNPRIVKEAQALYTAGFNVTLLYCFWIEWAMASDAKLLTHVKWHYQLVGGTPSLNKWAYVYTKAKMKLNQRLNRYFGNSFLFAERSQARCYDELLQAAKALKADWYIGHNLGAISVAVNSAAVNKAKAGFDFEDYHREESEHVSPVTKKRLAYLENKYVAHLQYFSTASPMITEKVRQNFISFNKPVITLLNCFPLSQQPLFVKKADKDSTLRLFWFSQTIGKKRGLEVLITVLNKLNDPSIFLTLAGKCDSNFSAYLDENALNIKDNISLAGIVEPENLPQFASTFDVGLAIELAAPENRNICLTNKIFTYLLAGNAIILSKTAMQAQFNDEYQIGESFTINDENELAAKILLYKNRDNLQKERWHNYELARLRMNWENESKKLLEIIA